MRAVWGIFIGIWIGLPIGALAVWALAQPPRANKADREQPRTEQVTSFACTYTSGGADSSLVLKGDAGRPRSMAFMWTSTTEPDIFAVERSDELRYFAYRRHPAAQEAYYAIELDRVTGEFYIIRSVSNAVRQLLLGVCDGVFTKSECWERAKSAVGSSKDDCLFVNRIPNDCHWVRSGNVISRDRKICRPVAQRF